MFDELIRRIEEEFGALCSDVRGSRVHAMINNPVDEGIAEG